MNVLMLQRITKGKYKIVHQREDLRRSGADYVHLGVFNGWDIRSHASPDVDTEYTIPRIYIQGDHRYSDAAELYVSSPKIESFEKAILMLNQKYSNNKLDMEDVILKRNEGA